MLALNRHIYIDVYVKGVCAVKAVIYDRKSQPDVFVLRETHKPVPKDNEVLVRIAATSLNAADYRLMKLGTMPKSRIFGSDIAGRVEAAGKDVKRFSVEDEVCAETADCGYGGLAEYTAVPEAIVAKKPPGVSFETAAALPLASVTVLQALRDKGEVKPGHKVLICGAGGGVGTFAVQLARHFGAEVTAVCGEHNARVVKSLGADRVVDYTKTDFTSTSERYNLILAVNGKYPMSAYKRLLTQNGICVMVGGALSQVFGFILFGRLMSFGDKKMRFLAAKPNAADLTYVLKLVEEGIIKPVIDRRYTMEKAAEAISYISQGHAQGKVVITIRNGA